MSRLGLLLAITTLCTGAPAIPGRRRLLPAPAPEEGLGALAVPCPRCGAAEGQRCNPATLGRYRYHLARVEAAEQAERERLLETEYTRERSARLRVRE